jgi:hypothetical protein
MEFEDFFDECINNEKYREPKNNLEELNKNLISNIEAEYTGINIVDTPEKSRQDEKIDLNKKIREAEKKIRDIKNPKGMKGNNIRRQEISSKLGIKREEIRKEISRYKTRLSEIEMEEPQQEEKSDSFINNTKSDASLRERQPKGENKPKMQILSSENKWDFNC